jgi:TonB family protein
MAMDESRRKADSLDEDYERTVLDFLNQEMAANQQEKAENPSKELDSIVSDLLKQVISESDLQETGRKFYPENRDTMLAEFPAAPEEGSKPQGHEAPKSGGLAAQPAAAPSGSLFTKDQQPGKPLPWKSIGAVALLAVVGGAALYFFSSSHRGATQKPGTQASASMPVASAVAPHATQQQQAPPASVPVARPSAVASPEAVPESRIERKMQSVQRAANVPGGKTSGGPTVNAASEAPKQLKESAPAPERLSAAQPAPAMQPAPANPVPNTAPPATVAPAASTTVVVTGSENALLSRPSTETTKLENVPIPATALETPASVSKPLIPSTTGTRNLVTAVPISQVSPAYPTLALRTRESATIVLELQIDEKGNVVKATPVSGPAVFHNEAVKAAMQWRYRPASINGANVPSQSRVTMVFNLKK